MGVDVEAKLMVGTDGGNININAHDGDITLVTTNPDNAIKIKGKFSVNGTAYD